MASTVYFIDFRATPKENLIAKIGRLIEKSGLKDVVHQRDITAIKLHFGELGNTAFINPVFIRKIVTDVKSLGAIPFLTDANTLYSGSRSDAPTHLLTAIHNGFDISVVDAPIIIADGLRGRTEKAIHINKKHFNDVYIASEIVNADSIVSVAHFKSHELSGFGGTLKNLGMGCASRRGKLAQHSDVQPQIKLKKCIGCGECAKHCSQQAITLKDKKAYIDTKKCIGCGECILICPNSAIQISWSETIPVFMEKMMEYTLGVLQGKKDHMLFINFINHVSPACDCYPFNDSPIVRDIGILASTDPVAIDQASVDLVNKEHGLPHTCLTKNIEPGTDKFNALYPRVDWNIQLAYAEELGIGTRSYEIETLPVLS
ncbi:MAG: DUF362 domain-containing protein [Desulfobacterales bacterium]|nr:DUF362 domain-containing protein [Desulfobacterales bacterium]